MADVITRLKVDSQEYDSKLKNAVSQMTAMEQQVRRTGASFAYADKEELAFVQSLGSMGTKAQTAKGKLSELTNSFTELSVKYKNLTAEEKASPFGQAMQQSMNQLKVRIGELNGQLEETKGELNGFGDVASQLGDKLGIPLDKLLKFTPAAAGIAAAAAAVAGAIKITSDALHQNELVMDEWGRITESSTSLYHGFLNALNTGDISGYLNNISKIVSAARAAYDAIDELGTFNAFNQINVEKGRTGLQDAITNFREGTGTAEQVKAARDYYISQLQERKKLENEAYLAAIQKMAAERGVDADMLTEALSGTYGNYMSLKNTPLPTQTRTGMTGTGRRYEYEVTLPAETKEQKLGEMLRKLTDAELELLQALGAQAQKTATEIEGVEKQASRALKQQQVPKTTPPAPTTAVPKPSVSTASKSVVMPEVGSIADWEQQAANVQQYMKGATSADEYKELEQDLVFILSKIQEIKGAKEETFQPGSLVDLNQQLREAQEVLASLAPDTEAWADALADVAQKQQAVNELQAKMGNSTVVKDQTNDVKEMKSSWSSAVSAISQVGGALQQIDDPGAKIAGIIAQAIASVASGLGQMLASPAATSEAWGWIALAISGTATMIGTIASIKSATQGYANGGMVGGNSYSGDNIVARLNSGEGVLTARGVQNAAIMASNSNSLQNLELTTDVSGTNLLIVLNNANRSKGGDRNFYTRTH